MASSFDNAGNLYVANYGDRTIRKFSSSGTDLGVFASTGLVNPRDLVVVGSDTTPPDTTITAGPSGTITTRDASFTWTGTDDVTPVGSLVYAYRLDPLESTFSSFGSATTKTYSGLANGTYTFYVKARDQAGNEDLTPASQAFTVNVRQVTALDPAKVWVGHGRPAPWIKFDLQVKVFVDNTLVGSGQVNSVSPGLGTGYFLAKLTSIPLTLTSGPVDVPPGSTLKVSVLVRNACTGSSRSSGTARLWYDGKEVDTGFKHDTASRFGATIAGVTSEYFLRSGFVLSTTAGTSHISIDAAVGAQCGPFVPFGTAWSITLP